MRFVAIILVTFAAVSAWGAVQITEGKIRVMLPEGFTSPEREAITGPEEGFVSTSFDPIRRLVVMVIAERLNGAAVTNERVVQQVLGSDVHRLRTEDGVFDGVRGVRIVVRKEGTRTAFAQLAVFGVGNMTHAIAIFAPEESILKSDDVVAIFGSIEIDDRGTRSDDQSVPVTRTPRAPTASDESSAVQTIVAIRRVAAYWEALASDNNNCYLPAQIAATMHRRLITGRANRWSDLTPIPYEQVKAMLKPYQLDVPRNDAWGTPFEFAAAFYERTELPPAAATDTTGTSYTPTRTGQASECAAEYYIRSLGADRKGTDLLPRTHSEDYDRDIVFANGTFVAVPERAHQQAIRGVGR